MKPLIFKIIAYFFYDPSKKKKSSPDYVGYLSCSQCCDTLNSRWNFAGGSPLQPRLLLYTLPFARGGLPACPLVLAKQVSELFRMNPVKFRRADFLLSLKLFHKKSYKGHVINSSRTRKAELFYRGKNFKRE